MKIHKDGEKSTCYRNNICILSSKKIIDNGQYINLQQMRNLRHSLIISAGFQPQVLEYQITLKMGDGLEQKPEGWRQAVRCTCGGDSTYFTQ